MSIIVNKCNYDHLPDIIDHIYKNFSGPERIQLSFTKAMGAADGNIDIVPTYEEAGSYFLKALAKCQEYDLRVDVDHIPLCFLGPYYAKHVDYQKKLIGEHGIFEEEKMYVARCGGCDKINVCSGYRRDYVNIYNEGDR